MRIPSLSNSASHAGPFRPFASATPILAFIVGMACASAALFGEDAKEIKKIPQPKEEPTAPASAGPKLEAAVTAARERAKLLHDVYSTTLDVMHHRYFRHDKPVLPARAMEDIFEEMEGYTGDTAKWISVNTKAMSINHEPKTAFEKKAAAELAAGKGSYELVENGVYQRAGAIPLRSLCVSCHTKMFSEAPKSPRFAGLVISILLKPEKE
jgi:hypothetical protein